MLAPYAGPVLWAILAPPSPVHLDVCASEPSAVAAHACAGQATQGAYGPAWRWLLYATTSGREPPQTMAADGADWAGYGVRRTRSREACGREGGGAGDGAEGEDADGGLHCEGCLESLWRPRVSLAGVPSRP